MYGSKVSFISTVLLVTVHQMDVQVTHGVVVSGVGSLGAVRLLQTWMEEYSEEYSPAHDDPLWIRFRSDCDEHSKQMLIDGQNFSDTLGPVAFLIGYFDASEEPTKLVDLPLALESVSFCTVNYCLNFDMQTKNAVLCMSAAVKESRFISLNLRRGK